MGRKNSSTPCKEISNISANMLSKGIFVFQLEQSTDYEERRIVRARLKQVMAEQEGKIFLLCF